MERIYGLIGEKLGHSHSPAIHKALGILNYKLYELSAAELEAFLFREDLGGLNVTIPYKMRVAKLCDELSPAAREIGAVNTVVRRGGRLYGYNTDQAGFQKMLGGAGISLLGKKVLVLGSGGSSHMVQWVAHKQGAASVTVVSRSGENNYTNLALHKDAEILVNTTPVGMFPRQGVSPVSLASFPRCCAAVDLVYNPLKTAFLMEAERLNIPCVGGLPMLVAQAAASAEIFIDKRINPEEIGNIQGSLKQKLTNLVLIGMPGSGKSTIGKYLGSLSGRTVLETDALIEEMAGKPIPEIFAQDGEEAFRKMETEAVRRCGAMQGIILVTGGGVVTRTENYAPLHQNGLIFEIVRSVELLAREGRPLSANPDALCRMERQRRPMYEAFRDHAVENIESARKTAEIIWRDFLENTGSERTEYEFAGIAAAGDLRKDHL